MQYMNPRPSSIVAALYTARDLGVDVSILHGPSGCSFKHARLLEEDGMRVITTSLGENEFIFGGQKPLVYALRYAEEHFSPDRIAVVGTCVSMIIGEDMPSAVDESGISTPAICIDIHAGFRENIDGVIAALEPAAEAGWISEKELERQRFLLSKANEVERLRGAACRDYITPSRGDLKHVAAGFLLDRARSGKKGIAVMNAKKETAYMFADEILALHEVAPDANITYIANLGKDGLPKVAGDATRIRDELESKGLEFEICGSLDEYGALGEHLGERIQEIKPDFALIVGVPHAIPSSYTDGIEVVSVTNGPRQVEPLREMGHKYVLVEIDLHPRTLGVRSIVESEFGMIMRGM